MAKQTKSQSRGFPWGDSYLNLIVGVIVVLAIGAVIIGIIRGRAATPTNQQQSEEAEFTQDTRLPAKHKVAAGEDLWQISEKYYKNGYNWVDIAAENKLSNPNAIEEGMELTIPDVAPKTDPSATTPTPAKEQAMQVTPTTQASPAPTTVPTAVPTTQPTATPTQAPVGEKIGGDSYTVVSGDNLWNIAVRAYGDGYKWVDIARANKLADPNLIYPDNKLSLPR